MIDKFVINGLDLSEMGIGQPVSPQPILVNEATGQSLTLSQFLREVLGSIARADVFGEPDEPRLTTDEDWDIWVREWERPFSD